MGRCSVSRAALCFCSLVYLFTAIFCGYRSAITPFPCLYAGCGARAHRRGQSLGPEAGAEKPLLLYLSFHFPSLPIFPLSFLLAFLSARTLIIQSNVVRVTFCTGTSCALTIFLPIALSCLLFCHTHPLFSLVSLLLSHMCVHTPLHTRETMKYFCLSRSVFV